MSISNGDIKRRFKLTSGGLPVSIPALNEMHVYVYTVVNHKKKVFMTFKKTATGEFGITIDPDNDNWFTIVINRNYTRKESGQVYAEVMVQSNADSSFPASLKNDGKTGIKVTFLETSADPIGLT